MYVAAVTSAASGHVTPGQVLACVCHVMRFLPDVSGIRATDMHCTGASKPLCVFEITHQMSYRVPTMLAVSCAFATRVVLSGQ